MEWKVSILLYRHALLFSFINSFIYMITFIICFKFMFIQHITVWRQARKAINKHSGSSIQMQATIKYVNSRLLFFICSSFLVMKSTRCVSNQPAVIPNDQAAVFKMILSWFTDKLLLTTPISPPAKITVPELP